MSRLKPLSPALGALATALTAFAVAPAAASDLVCDVRAFGAVANDEKPDTGAIQAAINACAGTGGTVVLPKGRWLSGGLELRSDMTFSLRNGAVLAAIPDIALYPMRRDAAVKRDVSEANDAYAEYQAFLYAREAKNLVIEGPGTLDGQGELFWEPDFYSLNIPRPKRPRPQQMMELVDCGNVTVRDMTLVRAPAYSVRFYRCVGVRAENLTIRNDPRSPNTDGIQIRDTSNAMIRGADIDTGDDAIVVKSYDRMIENLVVSDSILVSDDSAIKFGTAGHVGVRDSRFSNIVVRRSRFGIALFQMDGGAYLDNHFSNITLETGGRGARTFAIFADIDKRSEKAPLGRIEGLTFRDIDIRTGGAILISGQPERPIQDLLLDGVRVRVGDKPEAIDEKRRKPRGNAFVPPTGATQDLASIPSTLTIGNATGVTIRGLDVVHADPATDRSAMTLVNVGAAHVDGLSGARAGQGSAPMVRAIRTNDLSIASVAPPQGYATFLQIDESHAGRLSLIGADLGTVSAAWVTPKGVTPATSAVILPARAKR